MLINDKSAIGFIKVKDDYILNIYDIKNGEMYVKLDPLNKHKFWKKIRVDYNNRGYIFTNGVKFYLEDIVKVG